MQECPAALEHDCMVRTGRTLGEYADMGPAGMAALAHFAAYLGPDSMTWCEEHPGDESAAWTGTPSTNAILADIYDAIAALNANFAQVHSKKRVRRPKPYPRPNARNKDGSVGKGAIPVRDFDRWWKSG